MLQRLSIKNIALIHDQTIEFTNGLNVLTGETGAGKSLIIDSLSLLLGEKADKTLISRGETCASVEAVFVDVSQYVQNLMEELGLDREETVIINRKISIDGRNECRVNGNTFTLNMLKKLSAPLMDLHGQFEHQNLLKVSNHLKILDTYGSREIEEPLEFFVKALTNYKQVMSELSDYTFDDVERNRLIELYGYQMEEIDDAGFYEGEEEELKEYRNQVIHQERIVDAISNSIKLTSGDGYEYSGLEESIKKVVVMLNGIVMYYPEISQVIERLDSLKIELEDISSTLEEKLDSLVFDEQKAIANENRLDLLSSFKKKYGFDIPAINEYRNKIGIEYDKMVNSAQRILELKELKSKYEEQLIISAGTLTKKRKTCALEFERAVKKELADLGMKNASFIVDFKPLDLDSINSSGMDKIEFMFSANLGEPVKPLKAVASGGEMSRFMLAVKNVTAKIEGVGTLIFDEVDTGVSGQIGLSIAEKLARVSTMSQVVCVTHLAQISSYGKTHFFIQKKEIDGKTITNVKQLTEEEKEKEIARLVSGVVTVNSIKSAKEMMEQGKIFNKSLN